MLQKTGKSFFGQPDIWVLNGLDEAPPQWKGPLALLSLLIQMPILSGHTLTDMPRNKVQAGT